jgi:hypothetical protein
MESVTQRTPIQRFQDMLLDNGFEPIDYQERKLYWRQIGPGGQHVIAETIGGTTLMIPDWKSKFLRLSIYKGPELCEGLIHQEVAYILDDFIEFVRELNRGGFR